MELKVTRARNFNWKEFPLCTSLLINIGIAAVLICNWQFKPLQWTPYCGGWGVGWRGKNTPFAPKFVDLRASYERASVRGFYQDGCLGKSLDFSYFGCNPDKGKCAQG